jgi:hypothetical protein
LNSALSLLDRNPRIDVLVQIEAMTERIGNPFGIDTKLLHDAGMRTLNHLKIHPFKTNLFNPWLNVPPPDILANERRVIYRSET